MENNIKIYANSSSVKNKKDQRFEYIRAIAAIAVVIIHTMYTAIVLFGDETTNKFGIYISFSYESYVVCCSVFFNAYRFIIAFT